MKPQSSQHGGLRYRLAAGRARQRGGVQVSLRAKFGWRSRPGFQDRGNRRRDGRHPPRFDRSNPNQVAVSPWPKDFVPKDAIADPKVVVGRIALRDFTRGEPVVESKLVPTNKSSGLLSLKIPSGMRGSPSR